MGATFLLAALCFHPLATVWAARESTPPKSVCANTARPQHAANSDGTSRIGNVGKSFHVACHADGTPLEPVLIRERELLASVERLERMVSELEVGDRQQERAAWEESQHAAAILRQNAGRLGTARLEHFRQYRQAVSQAAADFREAAGISRKCSDEEKDPQFKRRYDALAAAAERLAQEMKRLAAPVEADDARLARQAALAEKSDLLLAQVEELAASYVKVSSAIAASERGPLDLVTGVVRSTGELRQSETAADELPSHWERLGAEFAAYRVELDRYEEYFERFAQVQDQLCSRTARRDEQRTPEISFRTKDGTVLVDGKQIIQYTWATHTFRLASGVQETLRKQIADHLVAGVPFVLTVNGQAVYDGVFTTSVSSAAFKTPVILLDPLPSDGTRNNELEIKLGYPSRNIFQGEDPRSNERLHQALRERKVLTAK